MADTSLKAFYDILETLGDRETEVMILLIKNARHKVSLNNLMISKDLNLPINCVTGRVNSLRKYGVVVMDKKEKCPYTGKLTKFWKPRRWEL